MRKPSDVGFMAHGHSPEPSGEKPPFPVSGEDIEELLGSPTADEEKRRVLTQWRERLEARLRQPEADAGAPPNLRDILGRVVDAFRRVGRER